MLPIVASGAAGAGVVNAKGCTCIVSVVDGRTVGIEFGFGLKRGIDSVIAFCNGRRLVVNVEVVAA